MSKKHKNNNNYVQNTEETVETNEQEIEDQDDINDVSDEEVEEAIDEGFKNEVEPTINEVSTPTEPETSKVTNDSTPAESESTVDEEKKEVVDVTAGIDDVSDETGDDEEVTDEEIDQFLDNIEKVVEKSKDSVDEHDAPSPDGSTNPAVTTESLEELRAREQKEAEEQQKRNEEMARLIKDKEEKEKAEKIRRIEEMRAQGQAALQAKVENAPKVPTNTGAIVTETLNARYAASNNNLRSTVQRKMSLNDLFNIYIKQRTSFFGLESIDDYKRIEEYLLNNKFYYNHTEIPETSIKQFLSRLKYNTNAMISILKK